LDRTKSNRPVSKVLGSCLNEGEEGGVGCRVGTVVGVLDGQSCCGWGRGVGFRGKDVGEVRAAKVGHVVGPHRERCNEGVASSKKIGALDVILEKWIEAQVSAKAREIVGVGEPMVIPVLDIHIPAHEAHLQPKDGGITAIVGYDEFDSIAIRNPSKTLPKTHMAAFVDGPIARKAFAQV